MQHPLCGQSLPHLHLLSASMRHHLGPLRHHHHRPRQTHLSNRNEAEPRFPAHAIHQLISLPYFSLLVRRQNAKTCQGIQGARHQLTRQKVLGLGLMRLINSRGGGVATIPPRIIGGRGTIAEDGAADGIPMVGTAQSVGADLQAVTQGQALQKLRSKGISV